MQRAKPNVYITDFVDSPCNVEQQVLGDLANVIALKAPSTKHLLGKTTDAFALLVFHSIVIDASILDASPSLRLISRCGGGYDNIDYQYAQRLAIPVTNVPDYGTEELADSAMALALALTRGTHLLSDQLRASTSNWSYKIATPLVRNRGRTFGILGLGMIGTATAIRAKAFGFDVIFFDPFVEDGVDKAIGIRRAASFDEFLHRSEIVSCHCPLNDETRKLLNAEAIAKMPVGSYIVNIARGDLIDSAALLTAIESGHLAGAGLDVLEAEPPHDDDALMVAWRNPKHPAHSRLIITPHAAFYITQSLLEMRRKGAENVRRLLLGEPLRNIVNATG